MSSDGVSTEKPLQGQVSDLRQTFAELTADDTDSADGFGLIADGLGRIVDGLVDAPPTHRARLEVILGGLETLADLMADGGLGSDQRPTKVDEQDPAAEFRAMFRNEARKRLSGLSISMMGIFNGNASSEALDQTEDHLHAMKGSAAMVGLSAIAGLVASMEGVVLEMKSRDPAQRTWPTRALMRGFHLLEEALERPEVVLDADEANQITHALDGYRREAGAGPADDGDRSIQPLEAAPKSGTKQSQLSRFDNYDGPVEKRILIVDDIETIAASIGFVLAELEVPIDMAEDGEEGLEMLHTRPYSLVVSDVSMPRMDGVALTRMIRKDPQTSEIPVILLTSLDRPDERDAGIEAGATDYIIKGSIGGGELLNRVKELLEFAPDVPSGQFPRRDDHFRILIAEDVETIAASIAFVLSEGPFEIEIARTGARALAKLKGDSYDLVLSDVQMPEMSGLELLEQVRGRAPTADLPVILLTSLRNPEVQRQALDAGASRFLIKGEVAGAKLRNIIEETAADAD